MTSHLAFRIATERPRPGHRAQNKEVCFIFRANRHGMLNTHTHIIQSWEPNPERATADLLEERSTGRGLDKLYRSPPKNITNGIQ